jgi:HAD superfamily hydrolase (TIGR01509 family)
VIEAVVFDFDGLVFDSETHAFEAVREVMAEHGVEVTLDFWGGVVGHAADFFDPSEYLERHTGVRVPREELEERQGRLFYERIRGQGPLPGVEEALTAARDLRLKIGLASNSTREWVEGQLETLGLRHYFDCVRTADDVERRKPEPDVYLRVLECLGASPRRAVAFEDSPTGATAARRAGLYCVIVPNAITAALEFGEHHLRLDSLLGAEMAELLERIVAAEAS